jgi:hypothetical protein
MVKERPILFSAPMVRAILEGRKTQTRRVCKPAERENLSFVVDCLDGKFGDEEGDVIFKCPYGKSGDRLWVRETWSVEFDGGHSFKSDDEYERYESYSIHFKAGGNSTVIERDYHDKLLTRLFDTQRGDWRPSIHMYRWASRIDLEITGIRVERLQDISEEDAQAEGIVYCDNGSFDGGGPAMGPTASHAYMRLWNSINGQRSWEANPWVWVIEFKRV